MVAKLQVDLRVLNQWITTVITMNTRQITLKSNDQDRCQGLYQDLGQGQFQCRVLDPGLLLPRDLHLTQVHSRFNNREENIQYSVSLTSYLNDQ